MAAKRNRSISPSLQGCRIALTVAATDPISPKDDLLRREAALFYFPVAQMLPPDSYDELDAALVQFVEGKASWLLLPAPYAVDAVAQRLAALEITPEALNSGKVALFGAKTALTAAARLPALKDTLAAQTSHAAIIDAMQLRQGDHVVVPLPIHTRADWTNLIASTGAVAITPPACRLLLDRSGDDVPSLLWGGLIDAVVFLTENSVRHFTIRLKAEGGTLDMLDDVIVTCLDLPTANAARAFGLHAQVTPEKGDFAALADALAAQFGRAAATMASADATNRS